MLGGVVVELQQHVEVVGELRHRFGPLGAVLGHEGAGGLGVLAVFGVPDLGQRGLRAGLCGLGERVEDVGEAARDRLLNTVASSCQSLVNLVIVAAESPWLVPRNWVNAGAKSEDDRPCRYSSSSTSATRGDFLAHAGRIAEPNRFRSPVASSTRLSLTRGSRTGIAPAAVVTSR